MSVAKSPTTESLRLLISKLSNVKETASGWEARCPAHEDNRNSLCVSNGDGGRTLVKCQAGCDTAAVLDAVGMSWADLFSDSPSNGNQKEGIAKVYDYRDANGTVLYQACRMVPKGFRQRRPDGSGGFIWNMKGVERVPYRLAELLDADQAETVYICEGEKDADRLAALGLIATCNAGGALKWRAEHAEHFTGRNVVVLSDNDEAGHKHAADVAAKLVDSAASVKIVELPGLPDKGDVSDWLDAGGTVEQLQVIVADAGYGAAAGNASTVTSRSVVLPVEVPRHTPFPVAALPSPLGAYVDATAKNLNVEPEMIALPLLAALSSAIGNSRTIELWDGWVEPLVLWTMIIANSGTKKSPACSAGTRFIDLLSSEAMAEFKKAKDEFDHEEEEYQERLAAWSKAKGKLPKPTAPEEPVCRRLVVADCTVEAMVTLLEQNERGLLVSRDELSGFFDSANAYRGGKGGDESFWLQAYNCLPFTSDRKTGDQKTFYIPKPFSAITGTTQPGTAKRILSSERLSSGMAARILMARPPERIKRRPDKPVPESIINQVEQTFRSIAQLDMQPNPLNTEELVPVALRLSEGAYQKFAEWYDAFAVVQFEEDDANLKAAFSKLEGACGRIAGIFHCACNAAEPQNTTVGADTMAAAIEVANWFVDESRRVYAGLTEDKGAAAVRELMDLIRDQPDGSITSRTLMLKRRKNYPTSEAAESALDGLVVAGVAKWTHVQPASKGGRPTRVCSLA